MLQEQAINCRLMAVLMWLKQQKTSWHVYYCDLTTKQLWTLIQCAGACQPGNKIRFAIQCCTMFIRTFKKFNDSKFPRLVCQYFRLYVSLSNSLSF